MSGSPASGLPPVLAFLAPGRRAELAEAYAERLARGGDEERALAAVAMQFAVAPSFVKMLLDGGDGTPSPPPQSQ